MYFLNRTVACDSWMYVDPHNLFRSNTMQQLTSLIDVISTRAHIHNSMIILKVCLVKRTLTCVSTIRWATFFGQRFRAVARGAGQDCAFFVSANGPSFHAWALPTGGGLPGFALFEGSAEFGRVTAAGCNEERFMNMRSQFAASFKSIRIWLKVES